MWPVAPAPYRRIPYDDRWSVVAPPEHEVGVTWLAPPETLRPYVRESLVAARSRRGRPARWPGWRAGGYRLVGWTNLDPRTPIDRGRNGWIRRAYWLTRHDAALDPQSQYGWYDDAPMEGVLAESVRAGRPSVPAIALCLQRRQHGTIDLTSFMDVSALLRERARLDAPAAAPFAGSLTPAPLVVRPDERNDGPEDDDG